MDCFCGRNLDTMLLARYVHARKTSSCCINYESSQGDRNVLSSDELLARKQVLLVYSNFVTRTSRDPNPLCSSTSTFVVHLRWLLGAFVVGWVPSFSSMGVNGWIVKKHRPSNAKSANPWVHRSSGRFWTVGDNIEVERFPIYCRPHKTCGSFCHADSQENRARHLELNRSCDQQ